METTTTTASIIRTSSLLQGSFCRMLPSVPYYEEEELSYEEEEVLADDYDDDDDDDYDTACHDEPLIKMGALPMHLRLTSPATVRRILTDRFSNDEDVRSAFDTPPGLPTRRCSLKRIILDDDDDDRSASPTSSLTFVVDDIIKEATIPMIEDDEEADDCAGPAATSTATTTTPGHRQVRFQQDSNGNIQVDITKKSFAKHKFTPDDIRRCWYSRPELRQMKFDIPLECRECIKDIPGYRPAALQLCAMAAAAVSHDDNNQFGGASVQCRIDTLRKIQQGDARGLERSIFHRLNIPRGSCKRVIATVLSTQSTIRAVATEHDTDEDKAQLIAQRYMTCNHYAIRFALLLAEGDAAAARAYCSRREDIYEC